MSGVFQDWSVNPRNPKARLVLALFRIAVKIRAARNPLVAPLRLVYGVFYRVNVEWVLGIELPWRLEVGPRLRLHHGVGLVVNDGTQIGADVTLRHGVTIGHSKVGGPSPRIGDGVDVGAGAVILGDITVGDRSIIGAGAVVVKDVPAGARVVGNPAREI